MATTVQFQSDRVKKENVGNPVVLIDIDLPFMTMVTFMVRCAIAAIPALMILTMLGIFSSYFLVALISSIRS